MENTMTVSTPTEVQVSNPVTPIVPEINLDPAAFQQEIARIAAEQGQKIENGNVVPIVPAVEPTNPQPAVAQPQAATQQVLVPDKFKAPDGQPDVSKITKSTIHAEEALKHYQEIERELRQKQNEVNKLKSQPASNGQTAYTLPPQQPVNPWAQYQYQSPLNPQVINEALSKGNPGQVLMELQQMTYTAAYEQARQDNAKEIQALQYRFESRERATELQKIAENDPWVFSNEGIDALSQIRQSKPWLNNAPEPWLEAYKYYKADHLNSASQVQTPNPQAQTVRVPPTPVQAASRTSPTMPSLEVLSQNPKALNEFLDQMTPQQQQAYWRTVLPGAK